MVINFIEVPVLNNDGRKGMMAFSIKEISHFGQTFGQWDLNKGSCFLCLRDGSRYNVAVGYEELKEILNETSVGKDELAKA